VGKTVESFRAALDREIQRWSGFARALRKDDKIIFYLMMDTCRNYASSGSNATRPIVFEPMVMSILLNQQKTLRKIEKEINVIRKQRHQL
jgi:hypothetical protein